MNILPEFENKMKKKLAMYDSLKENIDNYGERLSSKHSGYKCPNFIFEIDI